MNTADVINNWQIVIYNIIYILVVAMSSNRDVSTLFSVATNSILTT